MAGKLRPDQKGQINLELGVKWQPSTYADTFKDPKSRDVGREFTPREPTKFAGVPTGTICGQPIAGKFQTSYDYWDQGASKKRTRSFFQGFKPAVKYNTVEHHFDTGATSCEVA